MAAEHRAMICFIIIIILYFILFVFVYFSQKQHKLLPGFNGAEIEIAGYKILRKNRVSNIKTRGGESYFILRIKLT